MSALNDTRMGSCHSDNLLLDPQYIWCGGTCANKCGEIQPKFQNYLCSCDRMCSVFKDCCPDISYECPQLFKESTQIAERLGTSTASCESINVKLGNSMVGRSLMLVSYCQTRKSPCEFDFESVESLLQYGSPVLNKHSGLYFVNSACAACNGIPSQSLLAVETTVFCNEHSASAPAPGDYYDHLSLGSTVESPLEANVVLQEFIGNRSCQIAFDFPTPLRRCINNIHSCPESCAENNLTHLCRDSWQSFVRVGKTIYNNVYCVLCNEGKDFHYRCGAPDELAPFELGSFSLSLLFDINDAENPNLLSLTVGCRDWEMYPVKGVKCLETICSTGYVNEHGTCVKSPTMDTFTEVSFVYFVEVTYPNQCPKLPQISQSSLQQYIFHAMGEGLQKQFNMSDSTINIRVEHMCNITSEYSIKGNVSYLSMQQHDNVTRCVKDIILSAVTSRFNGSFQNESSIVNSLTIKSGNTSLVYRNDLSLICERLKSTGDLPKGMNDIKNENRSRNSGSSGIANTYLEHCFDEVPPSPMPTQFNGLGLTTIIVTVLSLVGLACRISLQSFYPKYDTVPCRMHCCLACNLAISNILLLTSPLPAGIDLLCYVMGIMKYFFFLNSFCLMTCIAWENWHILRSSADGMKLDLQSSVPKRLAVSSSVPVMMSSLIIGMSYADIPDEYRPTLGGVGCWFTNRYAVLIYFIIPVSVCVVINSVFFALTGHALRHAFTTAASIRSTSTRRNVIVYIKLFLLMGVTWMTLFFTIWLDSEIIWYIFVVSNGSQGIYLSIAFAPDINWIKSLIQKMCSCIKPGHTQWGTSGHA